MDRYRKLLAGTDFSGNALPAVKMSARLAKHCQAALSIVYSTHGIDLAAAVAAAEIGALKEAFRREAERELSRLTADELDGVEATSVIVTGRNVAMSIVDYALEQRINLCVVGTHGRTGLKRILIGSVAETVVRHAPCDVLTVPIGWPQSSPLASPMLVATDFSVAAEQTMAVAAELARSFGAQVHLVHVLDPTVPLVAPDARMIEKLDDSRARLMKNLDALRRRKLEGLADVVTEVLIDPSAHHAITTYARDRSMRLVVVSTHGRTGMRRALLGSVAERTVRHAPCPVLVVRPPATE